MKLYAVVSHVNLSASASPVNLRPLCLWGTRPLHLQSALQLCVAGEALHRYVKSRAHFIIFEALALEHPYPSLHTTLDTSLVKLPAAESPVNLSASVSLEKFAAVSLVNLSAVVSPLRLSASASPVKSSTTASPSDIDDIIYIQYFYVKQQS
ncbi:hypothetical protein F2Q68_00016292 [Brassica cretica]|uniref:Uncharacterized protein n=1 Tax=Brassica cretica TaxID=69181 RepID=A0A8S9HJQ3_BRACR|nr:hypothetical protein F2Q68_00016292 [Brassica cretica]